MELKKVSIKELTEFIESDWFHALADKPVTPLRVKSYCNNPHAKEDDPVLYYLQEGDRIIAYRTVFPARLSDDAKRFAWLSGNWVHPDFRRKGNSEKLLQEIFNDWDKRLAFTNYAPESLQLYLKTKLFQPVYEGLGRRFYLFVKTRQLLGDRYPNLSSFWPVADVGIKLAASAKISFFKLKEELSYTIIKGHDLDDDCFRLIEKEQQASVFLRGKEEFNWILNNLWVSTTNSAYKNSYAFSSYSKQFEYRLAKIYQESRFVGFLLYSIRDGHLKTLYGMYPEESITEIAGFLMNEAVHEKIELMTILNPGLSELIQHHQNPFLYSKIMNHRIYASFPISVENRNIQDGDGDYIFT